MRSTECRSSKGVFIATQLNSIQLTQLNSVQPSQSCFFMTNLQIESTGSLRSLTVVHVELLRRDTFFPAVMHSLRQSCSRESPQVTTACFNTIECKCNYSATSNNMTLVHWPLMSELLHLVQ